MGAYAAYRDGLDVWTHRLFLLLSMLLAITTPVLVLIDEANSSHIVTLSKIHNIITVAYCTASILWILITIEA